MLNFLRYYTIHREISVFCRPTEPILDFGCGRGELIRYLNKKGWRVYGIDPAVQTLPVNTPPDFKDIVFPSLEDLRTNIDIPFGAAILNFSLEHCENPLSTLKKIRGLLTKNGIIIINAPNSSQDLKNKKLSSFQFKIPEHNSFFTPYNLTDILENAGFEIILIKTPFCVTAAITPGCGIFPQLDPMKWLYAKNTPGKILKAILLGLLSLFFTPFTLLKSLSGRGMVIKAAAKRKNQ